MSSKRDSLFPTGSIGRSSSIARTASHESIATHPLLSPQPTGSPTNAALADSGAPRYVPYTPRHRVTPTSATSGATMQPSISAAGTQATSHSDATSKLQIMNVKAAAQRIGLDTTTTGWAILERLSSETDHGSEWNEIWSALSFSKATLLLPLDTHRSSDSITPEFIKDHIALCDGVGRTNVPIVTLSGLRGTVMNNSLIIRSTISPSSELFQSLLSPAARASALSALPPLPDTLFQPTIPPSPASSTSSFHPLPQYPTFRLPAHTPALPIPPRPSLTNKPPLPPRPGARVVSGPANPASRLSNPFASLFGRATPPASPSAAPTPLHSEPNPLSLNTAGSSPSGSLNSLASSPDRASTAEHSLDVPAYTISTRIDRATLGRSLTDAITGELRAALGEASVPSWAIERAEQFAKPMFPLVRAPATSGKDASGKLSPSTEVSSVTRSGLGRRRGSGEWIVTPGLPQDRAEDVSDKFQEFYIELEDMLWSRLPKSGHKLRKGHGRGTHRKEDEGDVGPPSVSEESSETDDVTEERERTPVDDAEMGEEEKRTAQIRDIMDAVERALCCLLYDRLFLPSSTDDAEHDEALSSRIAAVNLLDLGLGHLGVDVGESGKEVEAVVGKCGKALMQLDGAARSPAEKAAVLVSVHKIIVDGLARLPPIALKPEEEIIDDGKTPRAKTSFGRQSAEDEGEADRSEVASPAAKDPIAVPRQSHTTSGEQVVSPTIVLSPVDVSADGKTLPLSTVPDAPPISPDLIPPRSASLRSPSPKPSSSSRTASPTPVSGDVILPLMIFAVVKANPPRLVSNLLYIQRFRRESAAGGEEGYCLINLMAVAEFLENVDLEALGLGDNENTVLSPTQLSPIPLARTVRGAQPASPQVTPASLRGRVEQQVDAIAGSANKVLTGVVDSSFGVLRSLLPGQNQTPAAIATPVADVAEEPRQGFTLLRRDTGFSIASLAASLPGGRTSRPGQSEESGQQMIEVPSRPGSSRSMRAPEDETTTSDEETTDEDGEEEEEEEEEEHGHDARSIRSFESMMSSRSRRSKGKGKRKFVGGGRMSLADRLSSMPGLSRLSGAGQGEAMKASPPGSRRSSLLLPGATTHRVESPTSSRAASPIAIRVSPPNPRFLACTEDDIKVSEVGELLRDYKRLAEAIRAMGGFNDNT